MKSALGLVALLGLLLLRGQLQAEPREQLPGQVRSASADLPATAPYRRAVLRVGVESGPLAMALVGPDTFAKAVLRLDGAELLLEQSITKRVMVGDVRPALAPSPQGHAVSYSFDDGKTWRTAYLDAVFQGTRYPFACPHEQEGRPGERAQPTRLAVLDILGILGATHHEPLRRDAYAEGEEPSEDYTELRGAMAWALAHTEDEEMLRALARTLTDPERQEALTAPELAQLREAARDAVRRLGQSDRVAEVLNQAYRQASPEAEHNPDAREVVAEARALLAHPPELPPELFSGHLWSYTQERPSGEVELWSPGQEGRQVAVALLEDGAFTLPSVAPGRYLLLPRIVGLPARPIELTAPDRNFLGTVERPLGLEVRVRRGGAPVPGAQVSVLDAKRMPWSRPVVGFTDAQGHAQLGGLPEASLVVEVDAPDGAHATRPIAPSDLGAGVHPAPGGVDWRVAFDLPSATPSSCPR